MCVSIRSGKLGSVSQIRILETVDKDNMRKQNHENISVFQEVIPGPRILPFCHSEWGAVSDLGGSFHTLIFRCFVLIPSLCLLSASFFPLC